jgi:hypothetical protein
MDHCDDNFRDDDHDDNRRCSIESFELLPGCLGEQTRRFNNKTSVWIT